MLQPIHKWNVHIGLHRTATTNLQNTLALVRDQLRMHGVDYPTREMLRKNRLVDRYFKERSGLAALLPDAYYRMKLLSNLNKARAGLPTLIFSEEQWVGEVPDILHRPCYPNLNDRIKRLMRFIGKKDVTLFLSLREYSSIYTSAYSQALRQAEKYAKKDLPGLFRGAAVSPPNWVDLVRRVKAAAPGTPLRIWTFEDYIRNPKPILETYTGVSLPSWPKLDAPESTRGLSLETIHEIYKIADHLSKKERYSIIQKIVAVDKGTTKFDPFTAEEKLQLRNQYTEDLLTIERESPGIFIR
jgi:hypothetical protein